jgi:cob(I)alamin adenosyltransferase
MAFFDKIRSTELEILKDINSNIISLNSSAKVSCEDVLYIHKEVAEKNFIQIKEFNLEIKNKLIEIEKLLAVTKQIVDDRILNIEQKISKLEGSMATRNSFIIPLIAIAGTVLISILSHYWLIVKY